MKTLENVNNIVFFDSDMLAIENAIAASSSDAIICQSISCPVCGSHHMSQAVSRLVAISKLRKKIITIYYTFCEKASNIEAELF